MTHSLRNILIPGTVALALGALTSCGQSKTYEMEFNGCKTGSHTFGSLKEYCEALQNTQLNNGCAQGMRRQQFQQDGCEGEFRPN